MTAINLDILWRQFIRPMRSRYDLIDLGPKVYSLSSTLIERIDFTIQSSRPYLTSPLQLNCSHFRYAASVPPMSPKPAPSPLATVVYLHSNSGSRLEAYNIKDTLLMNGYELVTMDFSGSGLSQGEYISLGQYEQIDLHNLLLYMKSDCRCPVFLLGRSMGAVSGLLYLANQAFRDTQGMVKGAILDSPFSSMESLVQEICSQGLLKQLIFKTLYSTVKTQIRERIGLDMGELDVGLAARGIRDTSVLLMHSREDQFVSFAHSERIMGMLGCYKKSLWEMQGGHNDDRGPEVMNKIVQWLQNELQSNNNNNQSFSYFQHKLSSCNFTKYNQLQNQQSLSQQNQQKTQSQQNLLQNKEQKKDFNVFNNQEFNLFNKMQQYNNQLNNNKNTSFY